MPHEGQPHARRTSDANGGEATCYVARHGQGRVAELVLIGDVPTLVMHGDDDQIVPIADAALRSAKLLKQGALKVYEQLPHGMCTTHADVVNADLLACIKRCTGRG
jgi:pimeloyl-ACP methyl ester carboxylesterase